jgi:hypothetical protein
MKAASQPEDPMRLALIAALALTAAPLAAQEASEEQIAFVEGNVLAIFYHEFGHALVDILQLPVLGQEEDAVDHLSIVLTHELWDEEMAASTAWATALSWRMSADEAGAEIDEDTYAGVHGLDLQRHYTTVCLFYGANPEARADFVTEFALPAERAEGCAEEYALAADSWGVFLDQIAEGAPGQSITMEVDTADSISILLGDEVAALNQVFVLPEAVTVELVSCGEENAFYDSSTRTITFCTEYVDYLWTQAEQAEL